MKAFGRLEPTRPIGRGGAGEVWEAIWHGPQGFQKLVAIKHLPRAVTSQTAQQELIREARVGALLSHPNLVDTLDLVQHDGRWTLVMALVRGAPLSKLARGPWFPARVVEVGLMVCAGLTHVHGYCDAAGRPLGLVHRDIKLENLLVDIHGLVRIADLGIASWRDSASEPAGTPGYIAPEQLNGAPEARSDLFSLGVTLARLATGEAPFGRGSSAIAALADTDRVALDPALFATLEGVAPGLGEVIRRALRHDPALRCGRGAMPARADPRDLGEAPHRPIELRPHRSLRAIPARSGARAEGARTPPRRWASLGHAAGPRRIGDVGTAAAAGRIDARRAPRRR